MINKKEINVLVAGGQNVGKTTVCLGLARKNIYTASSTLSSLKVNVEDFTLKGVKFNLLDTPGFNNLINVSEDELKTKEVLLDGNPDIILHVANARHIFRSLVAAIQLIEFNLPIIMALNMIDEAEKFGSKIDIKLLSKELGIKIFPTNASEGEGIDALKKSLLTPKISDLKIKYNPIIEDALLQVKAVIEPELSFSRGLGILILISDKYTLDWLKKKLSSEKVDALSKITAGIKGDVSLMVMGAKSKLIEKILEGAVEKEETKKIKALEQIGKLSTHHIYGFVILGIVLCLLYLVVGKFGAGILVDYADRTIFGKFINPFFRRLAEYVPSAFIKEALVGDYGMLTMGIRTALAIILPIIMTFFFAFSFLEDVGYMPRLSVLLNRSFKRIGLNGRAILPIILGFSCVTMATISTRVLEEKKERMITIIMLALAVPCSAKLSVIVAILAPVSIVGILILVFVLLSLMFLAGYISSKVLHGNQSDFIMEIFPLKMPSLKALLFKTYKRSMWFLEEAFMFFIYGAFCLFLMDKMGILPVLERVCSPVIVNFLELPPSFTEAYLLSIFRGEMGIIILRDMGLSGQLSHIQIIVSALVITLSIPCLTNLMVIIKEYGIKFGIFLIMLIIPLSIIFGGLVNIILRHLPIAI